MSNTIQSLTQPSTLGNTPTRRQFLTTLATIPLIAAVPLPPMGESPPNSVNFTDLDFAPTIPPPFGPPERTEVIDRWITRLDEVTSGLERYWSFLIDARGLAPAEVDGVKMVNFESEIHALCDSLVGYIDCDYDGDNLITALTGRGSGPVCVEAELTSDSHTPSTSPSTSSGRGSGRSFDRDFWQREVDAVSEDHPHERARLQALLNAKYAGVL